MGNLITDLKRSTKLLIASYLKGGNTTTQLGSIPFQSGVDETSFLLPNTTAIRKFIRMIGDGTNGSYPLWDILEAGDIPDISATYQPKSTNLTTYAGIAPSANAQTLLGETFAQMLASLGIGQAWTTPAFDAANFTANGSMTWTVEAADILLNAYSINGKTMLYSFAVYQSALGGTTSNLLKIKIPASKTATKTIWSTTTLLYAGGAFALGWCKCVASDTWIYISKVDGANYAVPDATFQVFGQIEFQID